MAIKIKKQTLTSVGKNTNVDSQTKFGAMWIGSPQRAAEMISTEPLADNLFVPHDNMLYISVQTANGLKWAYADMTTGGRELFVPQFRPNYVIDLLFTNDNLTTSDWYPLDLRGTITKAYAYDEDTATQVEEISTNVSVNGFGNVYSTVVGSRLADYINKVNFASNSSIVSSQTITLARVPGTNRSVRAIDISEMDLQPISKWFYFPQHFRDSTGATLTPSTWTIRIKNRAGATLNSGTFTGADIHPSLHVYITHDPSTHPYEVVVTSQGYQDGAMLMDPYTDMYEVVMYSDETYKENVTIMGRFFYNGSTESVGNLIVTVCPDSDESYGGLESPVKNGYFDLYSVDPNLTSILSEDSTIRVVGYVEGLHWIDQYISFQNATRRDVGYGSVIYDFGEINLEDYVNEIL